MSVSLINHNLKKAILNGEELPLWLQRHSRRSYIVSAALSAPPWISRKDFNHLYEERDFKTATTGVPHVLDHVIPLNHPLVCGLTVPWNMAAIDCKLNGRKSNKLHFAFQSELFTEPEQLCLI